MYIYLHMYFIKKHYGGVALISDFFFVIYCSTSYCSHFQKCTETLLLMTLHQTVRSGIELEIWLQKDAVLNQTKMEKQKNK